MSVDIPPRCAELLAQGLAKMDIPASEENRETLLKFLSLMVKWNAAYNLTAVRDPEEMVVRHLLDSLSVLPYVVGKYLLDVGSGPGLPGIPMAILRPEISFTLLDSNGKKIRFIRQAILELGLKNIVAVQQRVENFQPVERFHTITARAFTGLPRLFESTQHLLRAKGRIVAMKGAASTIEKEMEGNRAAEVETVNLRVPFLNEERHLVIMRQNQ